MEDIIYGVGSVVTVLGSAFFSIMGYIHGPSLIQSTLEDPSQYQLWFYEMMNYLPAQRFIGTILGLKFWGLLSGGLVFGGCEKLYERIKNKKT